MRAKGREEGVWITNCRNISHIFARFAYFDRIISETSRPTGAETANATPELKPKNLIRTAAKQSARPAPIAVDQVEAIGPRPFHFSFASKFRSIDGPSQVDI